MRALCYFGPKDIRCDRIDDARIDDAGDAVVKMTACGICGSDLHIYGGHGFTTDLGYCVGHEAIGEVVEVGRAVRRLKAGDRVMISAAVGCGACPACLAGDQNRCHNNLMRCYGVNASLQGCQADAIRVPMADFNAAVIPDGVSDDQALMLTDNLPTAWFGCRNAQIAPGKTVAVIGLGPIGLIAVEAAFVLGAARVFAIDPVAERRAIAEKLGATALDPKDAVGVIRDATKGRMVESVVEAVGLDATIKLAIKIVARSGIISAIGVNTSREFAFPMGVAFIQNLTFRIGTCSVPEFWPELIPLVRAGRLKPERHITHRLPLAEGAEAYRIAAAREDGSLKIVLTP